MRLILAFLLAVVASPCSARWTFCVAEDGEVIWITDVFRPIHERERLESEFLAALRSRGVKRADAQCPQPLEEKADALNAQFTAVEFQRKLGRTLRAIPFSDATR